MTTDLTRTALLMDLLLRDEYGEGLLDAVTAWRANGLSWRSITRELHKHTGHTVSHESLRQWADATQSAAAA